VTDYACPAADSNNHRVQTGCAQCALLMSIFDNSGNTTPPDTSPSQRARTPDDIRGVG
jgi:hypothetical protein